jgi:hypothetical protein
VADQQFDDFQLDRSPDDLARQGTKHLTELSSYPGVQDGLPPLKPWYWRWMRGIWQLFPCTIVSVPIAGGFGAAFQFGGDLITGLEGGLIFGAVLGCILDARFAMNGKMIDE